MAWRTIKINNPAHLHYKNRALMIDQNQATVSIPLEDISMIILENSQIRFTSQLLSQCASAGIAIVSAGETHLPNGIFLPFLSHSRALQIMRRQLAMTAPQKKRLWQQIVRQKLTNQAIVLRLYGHKDAGARLHYLAKTVRSGDIRNCEAVGAQIYFSVLFDPEFYRGQDCFINAAMNYGYSIIRSAISRSLVAYGFHPSFGLHHHNEQNAFNLADDLIEPYRPVIDLKVLFFHKDKAELQGLTPRHKNILAEILHEDVTMTNGDENQGSSALLAAVDMTIQSLGRCLRKEANSLFLPIMKEHTDE